MSAALELSRDYQERTLCEALDVSRSTLRRYRYGVPERSVATKAPRRSPRALSDQECALVLTILHSDRFADQAPATIVAR